MLYLCFALFREAEPYIRHFHCKPDDSFTGVQVFVGEEARILLTGSGIPASATAVSHVLTKCPPAPTDLVVNIGCCACSDNTIPKGTLFLVPKITDAAAARDYYPDLLYVHDLPELPLYTVARPIRSVSDCPDSHALYDMEAVGFWYGAKAHVTTDRILIFKYVSDYGTGDTILTPELLSELALRTTPDVLRTLSGFRPPAPLLRTYSAEEEASIRKLCDLLQCSVTMESDLRKLLRYYELTHGNAITCAEHFFRSKTEGRRIIRKEGKKLLEQFRIHCLQ